MHLLDDLLDLSKIETGKLAVERRRFALPEFLGSLTSMMSDRGRASRPRMPVVDGYEATRRLRARGFKRPILALTAHAMAVHRDRSLDAGCDGHVAKPFDRDQLINAIAEVL